MEFLLHQIQFVTKEQLCVAVSLFVSFILISRYFTNIRNLRREYGQLLYDVAFLMLEKEKLEEDSTYLIEENCNLTQNVTTLRERNLVDVNEENNQLFHDVAMLMLENKDFQERNERLAQANCDLLKNITQLSDKQFPDTSEANAQLWQNYTNLQEENNVLKMTYENLERQVLQHHNRAISQRQSQCPIS